MPGAEASRFPSGQGGRAAVSKILPGPFLSALACCCASETPIQLSPLARCYTMNFRIWKVKFSKKDLRFILNFEGFVLMLRFDEKIFVKLHFSWNFSYRDGFTVDDDRSHAA